MRTALTVRDADGNAKTYEADDNDLTMGLCEDVINAFRADLMVGGLDDDATRTVVAKAMMENMAGFYPLASRLFPGLTEDEWRSARPAECVAVMRGLLEYGLGMLGAMFDDGKPAKRRKNRRGTRSPCTKRFSTCRWPSATASCR